MNQILDLEGVQQWMDELGLGGGPVADPQLLAGGTQNVLIRFTRGSDSFVLRRPPQGGSEKNDAVVRREIEVLTALAESPVPHARLLASCDDPAVLGVTFYVSEYVDGFNATAGWEGEYLSSEDWRREVVRDIVDNLAAIGNLDYQAIGLGEFGRPDGFLERQVPRWQSHLDSYATYENYPGPSLPGFERITTWLEANRPPTGSVGLMHGDFHLSNLLLQRPRPKVAAVVDWELSTIGDPLVDFGWLLATWPNPSRSDAPIRIVPSSGLPSRREMIERFDERSMCDLSALQWYETLACYKLGIILEGTYARSCAGKADREVGERLHKNAHYFFSLASDRLP